MLKNTEYELHDSHYSSKNRIQTQEHLLTGMMTSTTGIREEETEKGNNKIRYTECFAA